MVRFIKDAIAFIFTCIIVLLVIYYGLRIFNRVEIYRVKTGSMEDNIHPGDYILIVKRETYHIGDVVTFDRDGYNVTHRIIDKKNGMFITKGDANNFQDDAVSYESIIGKTILIGGILNFVVNYKYIIVGFLLSVYLFTCYFDKSSKKEDEDEENSEEIDEDNKQDKDDKTDKLVDENKEKDKKEKDSENKPVEEKKKEEKKEDKKDNTEEIKAIDKAVKEAIVLDSVKPTSSKKEKE